MTTTEHTLTEMTKQRDDLLVKLHAAETANATLSQQLVEHTELNGHIEIVQQCCDYLDHEAMESGDPSGKLRDFVTSISIILGQLDKQRRSRNWYETAYTAGKQKLVEHAVDKASARLIARVVELEKTVESGNRMVSENWNKESARLAARVAELERTGPLWISHAIAILHQSVDQTDPNCPVGVALTRAGLERVPYQALVDYDALAADRDRLATEVEALRKARDDEAQVTESWRRKFIEHEQLNAESLRVASEQIGRLAEDVASMGASCAEMRKARDELSVPRPLDEWHEDIGSVLWWRLPVCEPPYCGGPLDDDWPYTDDENPVWTRLALPDERIAELRR